MRHPPAGPPDPNGAPKNSPVNSNPTETSAARLRSGRRLRRRSRFHRRRFFRRLLLLAPAHKRNGQQCQQHRHRQIPHTSSPFESTGPLVPIVEGEIPLLSPCASLESYQAALGLQEKPGALGAALPGLHRPYPAPPIRRRNGCAGRGRSKGSGSPCNRRDPSTGPGAYPPRP